jgi:hypothetical protein
MGIHRGDASGLSRRRSEGRAGQSPPNKCPSWQISDVMRSRRSATSYEDAAFEGG